MGLSFLMNVALAFSKHGRYDTDRDVEKQDIQPISEASRVPHELLSSDDEDDHDPSPAASSRPLRQFATIGSTFTGLGSTVTASRTLTSVSSVNFKPTILSRARTFFFPKPQPGETARYVPYYRYSPIISGVVIPFSILLELPGLTEHWDIRTEANKTIESRPNPAILDVGLAFSMACAVFANICLILRFSEKWVKATTLFCILFLTFHGTSVTIGDFVRVGTHLCHRCNQYCDCDCVRCYSPGRRWLHLWAVFLDDVVLDCRFYHHESQPHCRLRSHQGFRTQWYACLAISLSSRTHGHLGSGLTRKQRSLVILVIILLMYIALGAWINSVLLHLNYINGLYFTVVSIETIGFGDIVARSAGARVWVCIYNVFGVVTLGIVISLCRDTVLEGLEIGYRKRLRQLRARRSEARRFRKWQTRWRRAIEWRLRQQGSPVWVADAQWREEQGVRFVGLGGLKAGAGESSWMMRFVRFPSRFFSTPPEDPAQRGTLHVVGHPFGKHLNINALSDEQLHAAALEAGVPLEMFVDFSPAHRLAHEASEQQLPHPTHGALAGDGWPMHAGTPTGAQVGRMSAVLTRVALAHSGREIHVPRHSVERREEAINNIVEEHDAQREAAQEQQAANGARRQESLSHGKFIAAPRWLRHYASGALAAKPYEKFKKEMANDERNATLVKVRAVGGAGDRAY